VEYLKDDLTPEYLLTQTNIENYQKHPANAWKLLSNFHQPFSNDPWNQKLLLKQIKKVIILAPPMTPSVS
jgi:hypothetical protein